MLCLGLRDGNCHWVTTRSQSIGCFTFTPLSVLSYYSLNLLFKNSFNPLFHCGSNLFALFLVCSFFRQASILHSSIFFCYSKTIIFIRLIVVFKFYVSHRFAFAMLFFHFILFWCTWLSHFFLIFRNFVLWKYYALETSRACRILVSMRLDIFKLATLFCEEFEKNF